MIGKLALLVCLFGLASAGNLYGGGLGYSSIGYRSHGYGSGYGYGSYGHGHDIGYSAPIVAKTVVVPVVKTIAPVYTHAPAISHVSHHSYHGSPVIKSYAPLGYSSFGHGIEHGYGHGHGHGHGHGYSAYAPALSYGGYGHGYSHGGYGYGGYGW